MNKYITIICIALFFSACDNKETTANDTAEDASSETTEKVLEGLPTMERDFDWQAHRGGRGLFPENTLPAFLNASNYPEITTLELDLVVSKDRFLVVSHEPWMSAEICKDTQGKAISKADEKKYNIYDMKYIELVDFDCGNKKNERFPAQKKLKAHKPRLGDIVRTIELMREREGMPKINYNIEIKSTPEGDRIYHPVPEKFAGLLITELMNLGIRKRTTVQSFDVRALKAARTIDPSISIALLVENDKSLDENVELLGFTPNIYSPNHELVDKALVKSAHKKSMKVIPWTVNEVDRMQELMALEVDGLITDYPDRIGKALGVGEEQ